ncbi:Chromatin associated protein KTI12 [Musa troglodytarum]|uniref:Chromatin associated protein KTI12 n=1 Tax=Musa troglodytarum TaxID=320322 RepID=A0A9E7H8M4_9LILI|nr:Chromatin associated protein KTI12 [Musa troglodytarum]
MALGICGQPCSGKSTAAACLADDIETMDPKPAVGIIDESSFHLGRNQSHAGFWFLYCPRNIAMLTLSRLTSLMLLQVNCSKEENQKKKKFPVIDCMTETSSSSEHPAIMHEPLILDEVVRPCIMSPSASSLVLSAVYMIMVRPEACRTLSVPSSGFSETMLSS